VGPELAQALGHGRRVEPGLEAEPVAEHIAGPQPRQRLLDPGRGAAHDGLVGRVVVRDDDVVQPGHDLTHRAGARGEGGEVEVGQLDGGQVHHGQQVVGVGRRDDPGGHRSAPLADAVPGHDRRLQAQPPEHGVEEDPGAVDGRGAMGDRAVLHRWGREPHAGTERGQVHVLHAEDGLDPREEERHCAARGRQARGAVPDVAATPPRPALGQDPAGQAQLALVRVDDAEPCRSRPGRGCPRLGAVEPSAQVGCVLARQPPHPGGRAAHWRTLRAARNERSAQGAE
jgi:hypothetical protein